MQELFKKIEFNHKLFFQSTTIWKSYLMLFEQMPSEGLANRVCLLTEKTFHVFDTTVGHDVGFEPCLLRKCLRAAENDHSQYYQLK